jgi:hypothetical protein
MTRLNKQFKLKKNEILSFNNQCFAFKKADYDDGCDILIKCNCHNCSFFKTKEQYYRDMQIQRRKDDEK